MNQGKQLKFEGLEKASKKYEADLNRAKLVAETLGMDGTYVTSDDVREQFLKVYDRELKIGNALGHLFDPKEWRMVARVKSKRPSAHYRFICQWQWKKAFPQPEQHDPSTVGIVDGVRFCQTCFEETEQCTCKTIH